MVLYVSHCGKKYPGKSRFVFLLGFAFSVILPTGLANDDVNYAFIGKRNLYVKRDIECGDKKYTLGDELGSGAFGIVFKGNPTSSGEKPAAVKVFYPTNPYERKHGKSEGAILKELASIKGFPRFYGISSISWFRKESDGTFKDEIGVGDGSRAIVMELVGETWEDRIKKNSSTPLDWFFPSARQVVQIVKQFGEKNKVHRDIKPENIAFRLNGGLDGAGEIDDEDVILLDVAFVHDIGFHAFSGSPKYAAMNWRSQGFNLNFDEATDLECLGWSMLFMIFDSDRLDDHHAHVMAVAEFMQELWSTARPNFDHLELILTNPPEQYNSPAIAGLKSNYNPKKPEELKKQFFAWVTKPKQVEVKIRGDPQFQDFVSLWYDGVIDRDIPKLFKGASPVLFGKDDKPIVDNALDEVYARVIEVCADPGTTKLGDDFITLNVGDFGRQLGIDMGMIKGEPKFIKEEGDSRSRVILTFDTIEVYNRNDMKLIGNLLLVRKFHSDDFYPFVERSFGLASGAVKGGPWERKEKLKVINLADLGGHQSILVDVSGGPVGGSSTNGGTPAGDPNSPVGVSSTNGGTPAANPNTLVGGKSQKGGDKSANTGLTTTDIIWIVAGAVAAIVLLGLLVSWLRRRCNSRRAKEEDYLGPEIEGVPSIGYASDIALASRE